MSGSLLSLKNADSAQNVLRLTNFSEALEQDTPYQNMSKFLNLNAEEIRKGLKSLKDQQDENGLIQNCFIRQDGVVTCTSIYSESKKSATQIQFYSQQAFSSDQGQTYPEIESAASQEDLVCKPLPQAWFTDYPILAYKSCTPDDNQIITANLAQRSNSQNAISLAHWRFLCFVGIPKLSSIFKRQLNAMHSHIFLLVRHQVTSEVKIMAIEVDPWQGNHLTNSKCFLLATQNIHLDHRFRFETLKKAECLVSHKAPGKQKNDMVLLLQFESDIWAVPLLKRSMAANSQPSGSRKHGCFKVFEH